MYARSGPLLFAACVMVFAAPSASAGPADLCPSGWSCEADRRGKSHTFTAPQGDEQGEAEVDLFPKDSADEVRKLLEMKARHIKPYGSEPIGEPKFTTQNGALVTVSLRQDRYDRNTRYITGAMAQPHALGGTVTCAMATPLGRDNAPPPVFVTFMADCGSFLASGEPFTEAQAEAARKREEVGQLAAMNGQPGAVAAYVFGLRYKSGVGGMVLPEYYPAILFEDGIAVRGLNFSPASMDISAVQDASPNDVGTWKQSGSRYFVEWPNSKEPQEIDKSRDKPQTFARGHRLNGTWTSIGGGGNTAFGGSVSVAVSNTYRFYPDGSFTAGRSTGAVSAAGSGWTKSGASGTYQIDSATLTLTDREGQSLSTSLFYDANNKTGGMALWIGGKAFSGE